MSKIPLPKGWKKCIKSAVMHALSLARHCTLAIRAEEADDPSHAVRHRGAQRQLHLCIVLPQLGMLPAIPTRIIPTG